MALNIPTKAHGLGTPIGEYAPNTKQLKFNLILGAIITIFGAGVILVGVLDSGLRMCLAVGWMAVVPGVWWFARSWRQRDLRVLVFPKGFSYTESGKTETIRWDEIATFHKSAVKNQKGGVVSQIYTVKCNDGTKYTFGDTIYNVAMLGHIIEQESSRCIFPRVIAAYNAGQTIPFGKLGISKAGISQKNKVLPWDQVKDVELNLGTISIKKEGKWTKWYSVPVAKMPNTLVFMMVVEQIMGSK